MAQHDYVIANQSGASFRADLNNGLAAIVSNNSGASAPSTTFAFQWWADTTDNVLKMRNAANDGWITIRELDGDYETVGLNNGTAAAPSLYFAEDADDNTGLFSGGADQLNITTGGTERAEFGASEVVFNDGGANYDFRVEGDSNTNLVVVDASADSIGIGTNAPGTLIEIDNAAPYVTFKNNTEEDTDGGRESRLIFEGEQSGGEISTLAQIEVSHDGTADDEAGKLIISTNDGSDGGTPTTAVTIDSSQNVTLAGSLRLNDSDDSNWIGLQAPSTVASNVTWTLPSTDGTADQSLITDGGGTLSFAARARMELSTAVASTSGTSIDFTAIPSWVRRIVVMLEGVSTNGTGNYALQIGDSGGFETTGYVSGCVNINPSTSIFTSTSAFLLDASVSAANSNHGIIYLTNLTGNTWSQAATLNNAGAAKISNGTKTLSSVLDRIRITTGLGTDTFDAGNINILMEG